MRLGGETATCILDWKGLIVKYAKKIVESLKNCL